uniref:Uncharacterized protein n=1 Tax=Arundo donax TaxID=35708 RepID=A0A0A9FSL9_ARUDO
MRMQVATGLATRLRAKESARSWSDASTRALRRMRHETASRSRPRKRIRPRTLSPRLGSPATA